MAYSIERTGKTVQEAVSDALAELDVDEDKVEIEILDEGSKGIFGILGSKSARVRVTLKESYSDAAVKFLKDVFEKMDVNAEIEAFEDDDSVMLNIVGEDSGIIIGRRGETLDSLQYLTNIVMNKGKEIHKKVSIDIENYRQKREETLVKLARKLAERVIKYKRNITLEPMSPYEWKIIHSTLQDNKHVETFSIGEEPNRKVVIALKHR